MKFRSSEDLHLDNINTLYVSKFKFTLYKWTGCCTLSTDNTKKHFYSTNIIYVFKKALKHIKSDTFVLVICQFLIA